MILSFASESVSKGPENVANLFCADNISFVIGGQGMLAEERRHAETRQADVRAAAAAEAEMEEIEALNVQEMWENSLAARRQEWAARYDELISFAVS